MSIGDETGAIASAGLESLALESDGPRAGATSGAPEEFSATLYDDGRVMVGVWECTPGAFPSAKNGITEHMYFLAGDATLHNADGTSIALGPGVSVTTPDGWRGSWEIRTTIRKLYTIWRSAEGP
jgi:uncharacterized cupin superfamily protein